MKTYSNTLIGFFLFSILATAGCNGSGFDIKIDSISSSLGNGAVCANAREQYFEIYNKAYQDQIPMGEIDFDRSIDRQLKNHSEFSKIEQQKQARYKTALQAVHKLMTVEIAEISTLVKEKASQEKTKDGFTPEEEVDPLLHLARLEMRSQIEPPYAVLNAKIDKALAEVRTAAKEMGFDCGGNFPSTGTDLPGTLPSPTPTPAPTPAPTAPPVNPSPSPTVTPSPSNSSKTSASSPLYGALYTMANAYQSCNVIGMQPVDKNVEATEGVVKGASIDGIGYGRVYTDVVRLKNTHYYHRGQSYGAECLNQAKAPLVYDYGGVPVVSGGVIDYFKNSGGGSALGVDCSAYISTAAAVAGNLYKESTSKNPYYRRFVSRDFINPSVSGWGCYKSVTTAASQSIQPGDIAAIRGHVVMVDQMGKDPFGLAKVSTSAGCSSLTVKNFDFTVIQSSPEKGSIGINRFLAKDYLAGGGSMAKMFLGYAKAACLSKFDGNERNPVTSDYGIIRHRQTTACLAKRMPLTQESCVQRCIATE